MKRDRLVSGVADATSDHRGPGRPRSQQAHAAILRAAIALIREVGYDALAMDAIAARAGVGKATIYRRWASKESLVIEAIDQIMRSIEVPDTGSVQDDLRGLLGEMVELYREPESAAMLSSLVAAMARSQAIAEAVRNSMLATRRRALRTVLERGIARGQLARDTDVDLVIDMLSGPLFYRLVVTGAPIDERVAGEMVEIVSRGLAPPRSTARNRRRKGPSS